MNLLDFLVFNLSKTEVLCIVERKQIGPLNIIDGNNKNGAVDFPNRQSWPLTFAQS